MYLNRTQELWKRYNVAMDQWINAHPNHEGAPSEGAFPDVGITWFNRHGLGIRIDCGKEIVEFDYCPTCIKKKDFPEIEEIDIHWSFVHFKSLHPESELTEEAWNASIEHLDKAGVLTKFKWNKCAFPGYELRTD